MALLEQQLRERKIIGEGAVNVQYGKVEALALKLKEMVKICDERIAAKY